MQFNASQKEITLKLVYYGPPLSGKTTNLQMLHGVLGGEAVGHLTVLNTADDRTLFFDLLPLSVASASGYRLKLKLFTVPGQVIHAATRRLVLAGADGVAFIADSRRKMSRPNNEFWHGMRHYLAESGVDPDRIPTVVQFNKRDLPDIRGDDELALIRERGPEPVMPAVAIRGEGVLETLHTLLALVFAELNRRYDFAQRFGFSAEEMLPVVLRQVAAPGRAEDLEPGVLG